MRGEDAFMGGPFFQMAYDDDLFVKGGVKAVLKHPHLGKWNRSGNTWTVCLFNLIEIIKITWFNRHIKF